MIKIPQMLFLLLHILIKSQMTILVMAQLKALFQLKPIIMLLLAISNVLHLLLPNHFQQLTQGMIDQEKIKKAMIITNCPVIWKKTSSIFMHSGSQSRPNLIITTRSSSETIAWSTCQAFSKFCMERNFQVFESFEKFVMKIVKQILIRGYENQKTTINPIYLKFLTITGKQEHRHNCINPLNVITIKFFSFFDFCPSDGVAAGWLRKFAVPSSVYDKTALCIELASSGPEARHRQALNRRVLTLILSGSQRGQPRVSPQFVLSLVARAAASQPFGFVTNSKPIVAATTSLKNYKTAYLCAGNQVVLQPEVLHKAVLLCHCSWKSHRPRNARRWWSTRSTRRRCLVLRHHSRVIWPF
ncbi:unnamed protein product [Trichogramma brassicae]|uniref:Uncharacterized protein n=1 Tax=Trichogramma brassicae TaxID=86971 RepID=A0A6H5J725_9HYME|nr:unnamed protein product [Trichogramma brassicae]